MAEQTDYICGNCGNKTVLFCDNEFTDFYCKSCGATNLLCVLQKIETVKKCKDDKPHDIRIARDDKLFCPRCWTEFGTLEIKKQ